MPNTYFQFKQFTVHQEKCAMKVCTDACLFGAWMADHLVQNNCVPGNILDIGAGTGLLSLMLAQQTTAPIDAIELDEQATEQARENFRSSPWGSKMQLVQGDVRYTDLGKKYDFILSNPPFFENDLPSPDLRRNLALHSSELGLEALLSVIRQYLSSTGIFAVLLPFHRRDAFVASARIEGFYLIRETYVRQTPAHPYFRAMLLFGTTEQVPQQGELTIRGNNAYTQDFIRLLKDYYLNL